MSTSAERLHRLYARISRDLSYRYQGVFCFETVQQVVARVRVDLQSRSRIQDFVPVLVENLAREELDLAARPPALTPAGLVDLLFVGSPEDQRCSIAAALAEGLLGPRTCVRVAGPELTELSVRAADIVVTLGGGIASPVLPGRWYQDWDVGPVDGDPETDDATRRELQTRVSSLAAALGR